VEVRYNEKVLLVDGYERGIAIIQIIQSKNAIKRCGPTNSARYGPRLANRRLIKSHLTLSKEEGM
jgi:hypothetical protein